MYNPILLSYFLCYVLDSKDKKKEEKSDKPAASLWRALFRTYGLQLVLPGFLLIFGQITQYINPFLLRYV